MKGSGEERVLREVGRSWGERREALREMGRRRGDVGRGGRWGRDRDFVSAVQSRVVSSPCLDIFA